MLEVGGGDLKGVEDGAGVRARNLAALERMDHLHESELKTGGVLDERNVWSRQGTIEQVVKTAERAVLESGLGAGLVVETDVGAARSGVGFMRIVGHGISTLPGLSHTSHRNDRKSEKSHKVSHAGNDGQGGPTR